MIEFPDLNDTLAYHVGQINNTHIEATTLEPEAKQMFSASSGFREEEDGGLGFNREFFKNQEREQAEALRREMISAPVMKVRATNNPQLAEQMNKQLEVQREAFTQHEAMTKRTPYYNMITTVLTNEAGFQNQEADRGNWYKGKLVGTNFGISAALLSKHLGRDATATDMKNLTEDGAREIYDGYYANMGIDKLPAHLQEAVVDLSAPAPSTVARVLQRMSGAVEDGVMGPNTAQKVYDMNISKEAFGKELHKELRRINSNKPVKSGKHKGKTMWDVYGRGWTNRINEMTDNELEWNK